MVFYTAVAALEIFGIDALVAAFKPEITRALSALAGSTIIADDASNPVCCNFRTAALMPHGLRAGCNSALMHTATSQCLMQTQQDALLASQQPGKLAQPEQHPGLLCVVQGHFGRLLQMRQAPLCR